MKTEMNLIAATEELGRVKAAIADMKKVEDNLKSIKITRTNQDSLCWLIWDGVRVGKIDGGVVTFNIAKQRNTSL
jgi:hypothetical protein